MIWLDEGSARLGNKTLQRIDTAFADGNLAVSAISFWEISMLVKKQRLELRMELDIWRKQLLESGLHDIPLDGAIATRAGGLPDFHGDAADRLIVATALQISATLATADTKILAWKDLKLKIDAHH